MHIICKQKLNVLETKQC